MDDIPFIQTPIGPYRVGKAFLKMSQTKPTTQDTPTVNVYGKTRGEHRKDIIIAVLVTGIIAFVGGMMFQGNQQHAIDTAVKSATPVAATNAPVKK